MKSWISLILAVIFLTSIVVFNIRQPKKPITSLPSASSPSPTATPLPTHISDECRNESLRGTITWEPAAGNLYGNVKLTNISQRPCTLSLSSKLQLSHLPTVKNIAVHYTGTQSAYISKMSPNTSFYATIHMPNGPQCQSGLYQVQAGLSYEITSAESLTFTTSGKPSFMMNICTDPAEITTVDISPLSIQPGP